MESLREISAELKKQNQESIGRVEEQTKKTLTATRRVTQRVGSDLRQSTSKTLADIGQSAKKTITDAPKMAISTIDPTAGLIFDQLGSVLSRSFGYIRSLGQDLTDGDEEAAQDRDVTHQKLDENNETNAEGLEKLNETIEFNFRELLAFLRGQSLEDLEREREEARDQKRLLEAVKDVGQPADIEDEDVSAFKIAPIFARIGKIIPLLLKGGAIALALGGLFALFRTIRDNPVFTDSVKAIKEIWENNIVPTFMGIKNAIQDFINSPTFETIQNIFNDIIEQLQNFIGRTLVNVAELFSGVFEGIGDVIEGFLTFDFKQINEGLGRIIFSITRFAVNAIDNAITAILGMFGVEFDDDQTLFSAVGNAVSNLFSNITESISDIFLNINEWISDKVSGFASAILRLIPSPLKRILGIDSDTEAEDLREDRGRDERTRGGGDGADEPVEPSDRRRGRTRGGTDSAAEIEPIDLPSRVAAARAIEQGADERARVTEIPPMQAQPTAPQQQQLSSVNISSHTTGILRDRPAAAGIPDNASDAAYDLSMMP